MKLIDAPKDRFVRVTAQDTKHAVCRDHQQCVIAKAIKRQFRCDAVNVGACVVTILKGSRKTRFLLNRTAREQVRYFDEKGRFAPCVVPLTAPTPSMRVGQKRVSKGPGGHRRTRKQPTR